MLPRISVRQPLVLVLGALLVAGAVTGCTHPPAAGSASTGEPPLDPSIVAVADPRAAPRPLAEYRLEAASVAIVTRAVEFAGNACMGQFGFPPVSGWTSPFDVHALALWSRYGLWDPIALETGYLPPSHFEPNSRYRLPFTGEAEEVYAGMIAEYAGRPVPEGGCAAEASRVVMNRAQVADGIPELVEDLDREAQKRSHQDSRVVPLLEAWRGCMRDQGWDYEHVSTPFMYWRQPPRRGTDQIVERGDISDDEKRSARDDLACKKSTGLLGTWLAVDVSYQHEIAQRERDRLTEYSRYWQGVVATANRLLAQGGR